MLMRLLLWATVPAMPTPKGILISSDLAILTASSKVVSCLTSKSFATKYLSSGGPRAKNNDPLSACVSMLTFLRILCESTLMSNSLATSLMSSMKSSDSSMDSRSFVGLPLSKFLSLLAGDAASHSWNKSEVMDVLFAAAGCSTACWTRCRSSGDACSLSHCSTAPGFDSSQVPTEARSLAGDGSDIAQHVLRARATTRMPTESRRLRNEAVRTGYSCRLLAAHALDVPDQMRARIDQGDGARSDGAATLFHRPTRRT